MDKEEYEKWYSACEFIHDEMQFYSIKDFMANFDIISFYYNNLSSTGRQLYQWYVFANVNINKDQKAFIWDTLNKAYFGELDSSEE